MAHALKASLVLLAVCCALPGSQATLINIINRCPFGITAFARHGSSSTNSYHLGAKGGSQQLNVGSSFPAGLVFASKTGNEDNSQATQLEITVGANGLDFYDISLVNAFNLPAEIQPINIKDDNINGGCGIPSCTKFNIPGDCSGHNVNHGDHCTNTDGPGLVATDSTRAFKNACPSAYSFSKDDATSTFSCKTGTNYNFIYCPQQPTQAT